MIEIKTKEKECKFCERLEVWKHCQQITNAHTEGEKTKVEHDIKQGLKDYIADLISRHSGEFSHSNRSNIVLPEPENDEQFFCHLCDILGSRSNLDMIYDEETIKAVENNL